MPAARCVPACAPSAAASEARARARRAFPSTRGLGLVLGSLVLAACAVPAGRSAPAAGPADKADTAADSDRRALVWSELSARNAHLGAADRDAKFERMRESPFVFFRGTNHLFWMDLAGDGRLDDFGRASTATWLQGDLHAENYGAFHDDEGVIVYDLNDFDESVVADYQYDLWRMATSLVLVGRDNGLAAEDVTDAVARFATSYLEAMEDFVGSDGERDARLTRETAYGRLDDFLGEVEEEESRAKMLRKWTVLVGGVRTLDLENAQLEAVGEEAGDLLRAAFAGYLDTLSGGLAAQEAYFVIKGLARRLEAGTGSLGTPRFYVLIEGPSGSQDDDVVLDVKRQGVPTAFDYLSSREIDRQSLYGSHAERVVLAQRALLAHADDHLGWIVLADGAYSVRERSPFKESLSLDELTSGPRLGKLAEQWGSALAAAHARADRDFDARFVDVQVEREIVGAVDGDRERFAAAIGEVAFEYAGRVLEDHGHFLAMLAAGTSAE